MNFLFYMKTFIISFSRGIRLVNSGRQFVFKISRYIINPIPLIWLVFCISTGQKMKFSIKDFSSKCDQIRSFLRIWSHLLKKSLMANFIFCAVQISLIGKSDENDYLYVQNTERIKSPVKDLRWSFLHENP